MENFWTAPSAVPDIIAETQDYLAVYKPPRMHTAPLREGENGTLLAWAAERYPEILSVRGLAGGLTAPGAFEGGLLHRLDYETHGLVLIARTGEAWENLSAQQGRGELVKEYEAYSKGAEKLPPGFPPFPQDLFSGTEELPPDSPFRIESSFRPYGPGRKEVRPVPAARGHTPSAPAPKGRSPGKRYATEGSSSAFGEGRYFFLRITKGFRHQIRCHLAWVRRPLVNDALYGGEKTAPETFLALRASALEFTDPRSGERTRIVYGGP